MNTRPMRIYIAALYTKGDAILNVRAAIEAGDELARLGFAVFIPHLSMLWHLVAPHPPEFWYAHDLLWLDACDCVLRLPGESVGADAEVVRAKERGIPVFSSVEDCWATQRLLEPSGD